MSEVNRERLINTFMDLVSIDSLSFKEREFADHLKHKLETLGISVIEDDAGNRIGGNSGNLFARIEATGDMKDRPSVLFSAHMDTVAPGEGKRAVLHDDGRITSDGSTVLGADDAGGISEILEAAEEIIEEGVSHPAIELFFPVAEEAYCIGSYAFDTSAVTADRAYFLDRSGNLKTVTVSEPTLISYEITVHGKASHAGFDPESGVNAIVVASNAIASLPVGRVDEDTTLAVGLIDGGTATNIVPDHVQVKGEIRSRSTEGAMSALRQVKDAFLTSAKEMNAQVEIDHIKHLEAYEVPSDSKALDTYKRVLADHGYKMDAQRSFGGSDTNAFRSRGIDAICIANEMHDIHTTKEYTTVQGMVTVTQMIKEIMLGAYAENTV